MGPSFSTRRRSAVGLDPTTHQPPHLIDRPRRMFVTLGVQMPQVLGQPHAEPELLQTQVGGTQQRLALTGVGGS